MGLQGALQSIGDGKKALGVKCYIVLEQMHVIEMKDWLLRKADAMQQSTMDGATDIFAVASQRAYDITRFVAGQDRATNIFTLVGKRLPWVKVAIRASASTGALSDASSYEAETKIESSTGATEKVPVFDTQVVEMDKVPQP